MRHVYDIIVEGSRKETTTEWNDALNYYNQFNTKNKCILVHDDTRPAPENILRLMSGGDIEGWQNKLEKDFSWKTNKNFEQPCLLLEDDKELWLKSPETKASLERAFEQVEASKDHINPSHYQSFFGIEEELQWVEAIQYTKQYRKPEIFKAAVELQARKYLDRLGGKDEEPQEIKKSIWYLKFLAAYIANGNKPIRVKDIDSILGKV